MDREKIGSLSSNKLQENQDNYDDLLVSIAAGQGQLNLLIAVGDDPELRREIIEQYETELSPNIRAYRVELAQREPSLRAAVASVVETDEYLRQGGAAVVTVTGAEKLLFLKFGDGSEDTKSPQEKFFGYLQWTREALRQFPFSIVLWVTAQLEKELAKKAPDFWSWRKGVFRFQSTTKAAISSRELSEMLPFIEPRLFSESDDPEDFLLPLADLQQLIIQTEQQRGLKDPSLSSLYASIGKIYKNRIERGECQDYVQEQALAIEYFQKAITLQKKLDQELELADSLNNRAELYRFQGRDEQAEPLLVQALEMRKRILGEDHPDVASSLNNLASLYKSQGRYEDAEPLYVQALEMRKRIFGEDHPDLASSLNNLAELYRSQGRYEEAEPLYVQALEIRKRILGEHHPDVASSLNNLALLYKSQGRYKDAEPLLVQALEMRKRILGENHPSVATSLNNLALLYKSQGRYKDAEPLLVQALEMRNRIFGEDHPSVASSLNNLASLYYSQGRYEEAEYLLVQALEIFKRIFGEDHPHTIAVQKNLDRFRDEMQAKMNQD
jgi:tetratricopeptide (TPR) repeat protein